MIKREPVQSSNIVSLGYSSEEKRMEIEFKGGGVYSHADVPQSVYDALMAAESKGKHYHAAIRGKFTHSKADS